MVCGFIKTRIMEKTLEELFNTESEKTKLKNMEIEQGRVEKWNKDLKKVNEIFEKLSFLNTKGVKIEKVLCTVYNASEAREGFYPFLRVPQFLATFKPIHDNEKFDFEGRANGRLDGLYSCESFVIEVSKYI